MQAFASKATTASLRSLFAGIIGIGARVYRRRGHGGEARDKDYVSRNRCECGAYNEAFIVQHWTGYNPRH